MLEPGRFRHPRSGAEAAHLAPEGVRRALYPEDAAVRHLVLSHTRPEPVAGVLAPLHAGRRVTVLGYISRGGTLDTAGLLFVNRSTWAHVVAAAARLLDRPLEALLNDDERAALSGKTAPADVVI
jgi:phosphoketolase